jgi:hypothetical protein
LHTEVIQSVQAEMKTLNISLQKVNNDDPGLSDIRGSCVIVVIPPFRTSA